MGSDSPPMAWIAGKEAGMRAKASGLRAMTSRRAKNLGSSCWSALALTRPSVAPANGVARPQPASVSRAAIERTRDFFSMINS
ncbi:hypothetical protein D3C86_1390930 [compost metagenome]